MFKKDLRNVSLPIIFKNIAILFFASGNNVSKKILRHPFNVLTYIIYFMINWLNHTQIGFVLLNLKIIKICNSNLICVSSIKIQ